MPAILSQRKFIVLGQPDTCHCSAVWKSFTACERPSNRSDHGWQVSLFGSKKMELLIGVIVGFVLGYGVRSAMSRYRRARARPGRPKTMCAERRAAFSIVVIQV